MVEDKELHRMTTQDLVLLHNKCSTNDTRSLQTRYACTRLSKQPRSHHNVGKRLVFKLANWFFSTNILLDYLPCLSIKG